jgi:hypothetical protein
MVCIAFPFLVLITKVSPSKYTLLYNELRRFRRLDNSSLHALLADPRTALSSVHANASTALLSWRRTLAVGRMRGDWSCHGRNRRSCHSCYHAMTSSPGCKAHYAYLARYRALLLSLTCQMECLNLLVRHHAALLVYIVGIMSSGVNRTSHSIQSSLVHRIFLSLLDSI